MSQRKARLPRHRRSFQTMTNRTAQEYHTEFGFPKTAKCSGCGGKPAVRGIVMMPADEAEKKGMIPKGAAALPALFPALAPIAVRLREGGSPKWYIRTSMAYSCKNCQKTFEQTLAKAPSYCVVEINRGPDPTNRVVVGGTS